MRDSIDLSELGWSSERAAHWNETFGARRDDGNPLRPARVATRRRDRLRLCTEVGSYQAEISGRLRYVALSEIELPVVGDWVAATLRPQEASATIHEVLPRTSALIRKTPSDRSRDAQVLAANVDTVWVVTSMNRDFNPRRIERTLALAREGGAGAVIVLSKSDLADSPSSFAEQARRVAPDTPIHTISALGGAGIDGLEGSLSPGKTVALIGSSGVGKSTLVNRLFGEQRLETRVIRADDDRGRHTTTYRELVRLPRGGVLIDTPGLREIGLWSDEQGGIDSAFPDVEALIDRCRFRDCQHGGEPGCAVREAIEDGSLDPDRLVHHGKLKREAERVARRHDARGRHEERKKHKQFAKMLKQRPDKRDRW